MREILASIVEKLFENVPFSRAEEELKKEITDGLVEKYEKDVSEERSISRAGELIIGCDTIASACNTAGCEKRDMAQYTDTESLKSSTQARRIFRRLRRYIYLMCICIAICFDAVLWMVYHFSPEVVFLRGTSILLATGLFLLVLRKWKRYIAQCDFANLRFNTSGRAYIYRFHDRYTKKLINTVLVSMAVVGYIIFFILISIFSTKYMLADVMEQMMYHGIFLDAILFLVIKNIMCKRLADTYFIEQKRDEFRTHMKNISKVAVPYIVIVFAIFFCLRNWFDHLHNWVMAAAIIYVAGCLVYDLTVRKKIVFRNIVLNLRRVISIMLIAVIMLTYNLMSMDIYLTQPYINSVSKVMEQEDKITYDETSGVYTVTTAKPTFRVLQLTDIHLGGSLVSVSKDLKALEACNRLIDETKPDFIVVTGDLVFPMGVMSFSLNNNAPIMQFANFMRNKGIPWAFTYGNHDTENMATLDENEFDTLLKSLSYKSSGNLLYPYVQPDIYGRSNQMIEIRNTNGALMQALFLLDSNDYIKGSKTVNEYDYIHDDQVDWYEKKVNELSKKEGHTIPSMLFFHIPLQEYKEANDLYEQGNKEVKYFYGKIGEKMIDKICCSQYKSKLFDTAVKLGSTKAMFCGHDHYNNQSVEYKGIRLTYGYSIDYLAMPGIEEATEQRGATLITIGQRGDFEIKPYKLVDLKNDKMKMSYK